MRSTLYPVLSAGGAEITIDYEAFEAGIAVRKQMKERQESIDVHFLVLTPDYLASDYCIQEMQRALSDDPKFEQGKVLPIIFEPCDLPLEIRTCEPLYVDLSGDKVHDPEQWLRIMKACGAELGMTVPDWLGAFRRVLKNLRDRRSVNLLVNGPPK